eukprot:jgi/Tetstr1/421336/TSEL_012307.t1
MASTASALTRSHVAAGSARPQQRSLPAGASPLSRRQSRPPARRPHHQERVVLRCEATNASSSSDAQVTNKPGARMLYAPASYDVLIQDACTAIQAGIANGLDHLEVEFPPVPGQVDGYKESSDAFIDANIQLALVAARKLSNNGEKRVHVVLPDDVEYNRAAKMFKSTLELEDNVTLGYLTEKEWSFKLSLKGLGIGLSNSMYESKEVAERKTTEFAEKADIFIATNASAVELTEIEKYKQSVVGDRPLVLWNLELDTLRADLGLLGFPPKSLQYNFLCKFKPVFYIRQRDYSKTVSVAPFLLNYSGALFREFPGPWQVMLKQDNGDLACIAERPDRYTLTEAKEEMMEAMGLNTEEEGSTMAFLRRGYKVATWWEEDADKENDKSWRMPRSSNATYGGTLDLDTNANIGRGRRPTKPGGRPTKPNPTKEDKKHHPDA